jgi:DNA adenine methylase
MNKKLTQNVTVKRFMNAPIGWLGGKYRLAPRLISMFPPAFKLYAEGFGGGGSVLFTQAPVKGRVEIYNDIDSDLVNFFRVLKHAPGEFLASLQYELISRENFNLFLEKLKSPESLSNVERAKMFYLVVRLSFAGQRKSFGISATDRLFNFKGVYDIVNKVYDRLSAVTIENLDFRRFIEIYDRVFTLFYLDPPYRTKSSRAYAQVMTDVDYRDLRDILKGIKGRFMLSINDDGFIRELFKDFRIDEIETSYSVEKGKSKKVSELVIMNY